MIQSTCASISRRWLRSLSDVIATGSMGYGKLFNSLGDRDVTKISEVLLLWRSSRQSACPIKPLAPVIRIFIASLIC